MREYELVEPSHDPSDLGGVRTPAINRSGQSCELTLVKLQNGKLRADFEGWRGHPTNVRSMGRMTAFDIDGLFTLEYLIPMEAWRATASLGLYAK